MSQARNNNTNNNSSEVGTLQTSNNSSSSNAHNRNEFLTGIFNLVGHIIGHQNLTSAADFVNRAVEIGTQLVEFGSTAADINQKMKQLILDPSNRFMHPRKIQILRQALRCACLSHISYNPPVPVQLKLDDETRFVTISCQSDLTQSSKYSVFWFIAKKVDEDVVYLIFRGTSSLDDVLIDLAADLDAPEFYKNHNLKVHKGAQTALMNELEKILTCLNKILDPDTTLYITGHSLGGGIALLSYLYFKTQIPQFKEMNNVFVYSFGAPLVLGSVPGCEWSDWLRVWEENVYCFVNNCDIVPRVLGNKNISLPPQISQTLQEILRQQSNRNLLFLQNFLENSESSGFDLSNYSPYGNILLFVGPSSIVRALTFEDEELIHSIVAPVALGALTDIRRLINDHAIMNYITFLKKYLNM